MDMKEVELRMDAFSRLSAQWAGERLFQAWTNERTRAIEASSFSGVRLSTEETSIKKSVSIVN